ncbi:glycosyltransferase family 2 protein [Leeuwenhoekiella aequorea]|uniref:Glycosyltransferase involved in cell wall biosynthesis n=1 Tax=Leeuwenhoekiella aequorea TaxID=283736 RepID=A0A4Q0PEH5_9FLAO|nr:glycosyltransferase family A protein [Leeuwenhoekiella aequorea]RXG24896.1 glycosyltransferase involved in cell wall biosynthesis [Leeuwenhoekiella aequorea]
MNVLVSIIVPCYNQGRFLGECLLSIQNQTYENWECIIINDGSSDDTLIITNKWTAKDQRFSCINQENKGLSASRNIGIKKASGTYILPIDADDKIKPEYLSRGLAVFKKNLKLKIVYCNAEKFGMEEGIWDLPKYSLRNLALMNMIFCSAIFKKEDWSNVGGYDTKMVYGWEDWEFYISLLKNGGEVLKLDYVGFCYRIKNKSMINSINAQQSSILLKYLNQKHQDFYIEQFGIYHDLLRKFDTEKKTIENQLNSKRIILDRFLKLFCGINISKYILKKR